VVKHEFVKLDAELLADKIEYIFATTIDVVLELHTARKAVKSPMYGRYYLELLKDCVNVYEKADRTSKVVATSPPDLLRLDTDYKVLGLQGDAFYWHVHDMGENHMLWGFIHADDVQDS
jgi:hypothetical protein